MNEIVILSGKGGTGKTSLSAAFATLDTNLVVADCDVDAANLYLILQPFIAYYEKFITGYKAVIDCNLCTNCGLCVDYCRFGAISLCNGNVTITDLLCDRCKLCSRICPAQAVKMTPSNKSQWYVGTYRNGRMVHARLAPGEENSGKLVNIVRELARKMAVEYNAATIIIDGPPGVGCPVISSVTGADRAILVTEPSMSAFHDLKRIFELTENFKVESFVVINKYDLNYEVTLKIEEWCCNLRIPVVGKIPFDKQIVEAMLHCKSIVEWKPDSATSQVIRNIWKTINC
jgi:MinD superfamily P-loop ATPase